MQIYSSATYTWAGWVVGHIDHTDHTDHADHGWVYLLRKYLYYYCCIIQWCGNPWYFPKMCPPVQSLLEKKRIRKYHDEKHNNIRRTLKKIKVISSEHAKKKTRETNNNNLPHKIAAIKTKSAKLLWCSYFISVSSCGAMIHALLLECQVPGTQHPIYLAGIFRV